MGKGACDAGAAFGEVDVGFEAVEHDFYEDVVGIGAEWVGGVVFEEVVDGGAVFGGAGDFDEVEDAAFAKVDLVAAFEAVGDEVDEGIVVGGGFVGEGVEETGGPVGDALGSVFAKGICEENEVCGLATGCVEGVGVVHPEAVEKGEVVGVECDFCLFFPRGEIVGGVGPFDDFVLEFGRELLPDGGGKVLYGDLVEGIVSASPGECGVRENERGDGRCHGGEKWVRTGQLFSHKLLSMIAVVGTARD